MLGLNVALWKSTDYSYKNDAIGMIDRGTLGKILFAIDDFVYYDVVNLRIGAQ